MYNAEPPGGIHRRHHRLMCRFGIGINDQGQVFLVTGNKPERLHKCFDFVIYHQLLIDVIPALFIYGHLDRL